jgi:hypothetical protein
VRSSVIRLVKRAFQEAGISLPDEAREVVFPRGVPIRLEQGPAEAPRERPAPPPETDAACTAGEAGFGTEATAIGDQARRSWMPDEENLLESAPRPTASHRPS